MALTITGEGDRFQGVRDFDGDLHAAAAVPVQLPLRDHWAQHVPGVGGQVLVPERAPQAGVKHISQKGTLP